MSLLIFFPIHKVLVEFFSAEPLLIFKILIILYWLSNPIIICYNISIKISHLPTGISEILIKTVVLRAILILQMIRGRLASLSSM